MKLIDYLQREDSWSMSKLAEETGLSRQSLYSYANGKSTPTIKNAILIEQATRGMVTVYHWGFKEPEAKNNLDNLM